MKSNEEGDRKLENSETEDWKFKNFGNGRRTLKFRKRKGKFGNGKEFIWKGVVLLF